MSNVIQMLFIVPTGVAFAVLAIAVAPTGQQMTDAMYAAFGDNHSRAVHAKGTMVEGTFTPDPAARSLSKAKLFMVPTAPTRAAYARRRRA
jgi:catalase